MVLFNLFLVIADIVVQLFFNLSALFIRRVGQTPDAEGLLLMQVFGCGQQQGIVGHSPCIGGKSLLAVIAVSG